jgi:phage terminase large subunit-like protein
MIDAEILAASTPEEIAATAASLTEAQCRELLFCWELWSRPEQELPAGDWRTWLIKAGRGFGKTRTGAETVRGWVDVAPFQRIALIGPTAADVRDVMIEGESGLMHVFPPAQRPHYEPSKRKITFHNGTVGFCYSAEEPERLRGPQHHWAWGDEIATYPDPEALWSNLKFGLRLGADPRMIATTTPKPSRFLKTLMADRSTAVTHGSTFDNRANLPASVLEEFERVYGGTRIGRQELMGEVLEDIEGALWRLAQIDALRVREAPELVRIVIPIDPSVTSGPDSDECGIVPVGLGVDGHGYVLGDHSGRMAADKWAAKSVDVFDVLEADKIIAEINNGGDLVEATIRTVRSNIPYEAVHASRGKLTRAEPIAALYEQGKVHHVGGFRELETEMCTWVPNSGMRSPNRMDSLVWGLSYLMLKPKRKGSFHSL